MKLLFTLLLFLSVLVASAQNLTSYAALPKDSATQKVTYMAIVQVPGVSEAELFGRAAEWLARQKELDRNGAVADPASGRQVAHLRFKQPPLSFTDTHSNLYEFAVAVYTKEGKYFYRLDDFTYQNINPALMTKDAEHRLPIEYYATIKENKRVAATLADFNQRITAMIASLNAAMMSGKATPKGF
jgi:hypothetical protein